MTPVGRWTGVGVLLRSLAIQGSWNYETLIGTGFAFTIAPVLRRLYGRDSEAFAAALTRHAEVFNSHPYLATVAVGAVSRMEADGADPQVISRFKSALRGPLGSLGDQIVWSAWRPASVLLGVVLLLAGVVWWVAILAFLVCYNAVNAGLRIWGWRVGIRSGMEVGKALREAPLQELSRRATQVGALLAGMATALLFSFALNDPLAMGLDVAAICLGIYLGLRARKIMAVVIGAGWVAGTLAGLVY